MKRINEKNNLHYYRSMIYVKDQDIFILTQYGEGLHRLTDTDGLNRIDDQVFLAYRDERLFLKYLKTHKIDMIPISLKNLIGKSFTADTLKLLLKE